jgi:predicted GIY-YIG superfamily endonuclease
MADKIIRTKAMKEATRQAIGTGQQGTIYLIHFDTKIGHAAHYVGWTSKGGLLKRMAHHRNGTGSKLMAEAKRRGIGWSVVYLWEGDRHFERYLKDKNGSAKICPCCKEAAGK